MAVCSCALTLSIAATPALAANSNSTCPNQGANVPRSHLFVRYSLLAVKREQAEIPN